MADNEVHGFYAVILPPAGVDPHSMSLDEFVVSGCKRCWGDIDRWAAGRPHKIRPLVGDGHPWSKWPVIAILVRWKHRDVDAGGACELREYRFTPGSDMLELVSGDKR